jgi:hypothetical protein
MLFNHCIFILISIHSIVHEGITAGATHRSGSKMILYGLAFGAAASFGDAVIKYQGICYNYVCVRGYSLNYNLYLRVIMIQIMYVTANIYYLHRARPSTSSLSLLFCSLF